MNVQYYICTYVCIVYIEACTVCFSYILAWWMIDNLYCKYAHSSIQHIICQIEMCLLISYLVITQSILTMKPVCWPVLHGLCMHSFSFDLPLNQDTSMYFILCVLLYLHLYHVKRFYKVNNINFVNLACLPVKHTQFNASCQLSEVLYNCSQIAVSYGFGNRPVFSKTPNVVNITNPLFTLEEDPTRWTVMW